MMLYGANYHAHNMEWMQKQRSRSIEEPRTPLKATRVCEGISSMVFATSNATVHLHCRSLANEGRRRLPCHTGFDRYLADGESHVRKMA